jgi:hypothetical protein
MHVGHGEVEGVDANIDHDARTTTAKAQPWTAGRRAVVEH